MQHQAQKPSQHKSKAGGKPEAKGDAKSHPAQGKDYAEGAAAVVPDGDETPHKMQGGTAYTVKPGDTLSGIAAATLGSAGRWPDIWKLNKSKVPNPDLIHPGQQLRLPPAGAPKGPSVHEPTDAAPGEKTAGPAGKKAPKAEKAGQAEKKATDQADKGEVKGVKKNAAPGEPGAKPTTPAGKAPARTYTVKSGDTLAQIAMNEMGSANRWPALWAANKALLPNPHDIHAGDVLKIPDGQGLPPPDPKPDKPKAAPGHEAKKPGGKGSVPDAKPGKGGKTDDKDLAPKGQQAVGRNPLEKQMAELYNTKGKFIASEAARLGIETGVAAACLMCESGGAGYVGGKLKIRFEPGIFKGYTGKYVSDAHESQGAEYDAFQRAQHVHKQRAYDSISMGAAQIMGFNSAAIGYGSALEMFEEFQRSEAAQLAGFFSFVASQRVLVKAAKGKDWGTFALHYNGPGYKANAYDTKMANYFAAWNRVMAGMQAKA